MSILIEQIAECGWQIAAMILLTAIVMAAICAAARVGEDRQ